MNNVHNVNKIWDICIKEHVLINVHMDIIKMENSV